MNFKKLTIVVSIDLEKVFDTVYTYALIFKVSKMKIFFRLIQVIHNYISNYIFQLHKLLNICNISGIPPGICSVSCSILSIYQRKLNDHGVSNALYLDD